MLKAKYKEKDRQCMYKQNKLFHKTIVAMEKQYFIF